jgi:hypothetical protein
MAVQKLADVKGDERLVKLVIESSVCKKLYRDLQTCGISRSTLFPDLEGSGGELARAWRVNSFYQRVRA